METESQASEESVSPGASPLRAGSVTESLSTSQELDNLKGRSILANDNLKTSSTPDDNLIEKVKVLFVENSFHYVVFLTRWTTE